MHPPPSLVAKLVRFGLVGVGGTLLYAGLAFLLEGAGMPLFWAHAMASAISLAASYLGQKILTFNIRGRHREMGARFALATAGLVLVQSIGVFLLAQSGINAQLTLLASTLFYPPASFLTHTFWTFRSSQNSAI